MPTSKQRGRVRRSTGKVVRESVARRQRMGVVEPGYRVAGWMPEGTIEGCGGGEWDAEGLKRSRLAGCQSRAGAVYDGGELELVR